jgi:hypothetical protein
MRNLLARVGVLAAMLVVCAGIAHAQGGYFQAVVQNSAGRPVGGALVAVCSPTATQGTPNTPCSSVVNIFLDQGLTEIAPNPFQADGLGNVQFWVAPGIYTIQYYGPTVNLSFGPIQVSCNPTGTGCGGGGGGGIFGDVVNTGLQPIILNGNFEASATLPPDGWVGNSNAALTYETVAPYEGLQTLKMLANTDSSGAAVFTLNSTNAQPGNVFSIQAHLKSDGVVSANAGINFVDKNFNSIGGSPSCAASTTSTTYVLVSQTCTAPAGTVFMQPLLVSLPFGTAGTTWYDTIEIYREDIPGLISPFATINGNLGVTGDGLFLGHIDWTEKLTSVIGIAGEDICQGRSAGHGLQCSFNGDTPAIVARQANTLGTGNILCDNNGLVTNTGCPSGGGNVTTAGAIPLGETVVGGGGAAILPSTARIDCSVLAGGSVGAKLNACNAAIIAAGGGTADATGLSLTGAIPATWTVGNSSGAPVTFLVPTGAVWTSTITDGTSCALKQFNGTSIIGMGPAATGTATTRLLAGATTAQGAMYCTDTTVGGFIRLEGMTFWDNIARSGGGAINSLGTSFLWQETLDIAQMHDVFVFDSSDPCAATITGVDGVTHANGLHVDGVFGAGVTPLCMTGTTGGTTNKQINEFACENCSIVHPGSGKHVITVTDTSGIGPTSNTVLTFSPCYIESSSSDTTTSLIFLTNVKSFTIVGCEDLAQVSSTTAPFIEYTYPAGQQTSISAIGLVVAAAGGKTTPSFPITMIKNDVNSALNVLSDKNGFLPQWNSNTSFFDSLALGSFTVSTLPTPANYSTGAIVVVTDASTAGSCTVGSGSALALCRNSGSAWVSLGGAGGGAPGGTTDALQYNNAGAFAGLASPTANGLYDVIYNVVGGVAVPPTTAIPGVPIDARTTATETVAAADNGKVLTASNAAASAYTGPTLVSGNVFGIFNVNKGIVTYTPASGNVNGNATQIICPGCFAFAYTDGTLTQMPVMPTTQAMVYATLADSATVAWATNGPFSNASLTFTVHSGSRTLNVTGLINGGNYVLKLIQDSTGGEGLTLGSGCTWKVIGGGGGAVSLTASANAVDVLAWTYDGTNCLATLGKNFN